MHVLDVGEGPVVLLLHGTGRSVADWQEGLAERLAVDHRVVGFDYYGQGLSDRARPFRNGTALWVEQTLDVIDALGIERVTVVGHSVGGSVTAMFTADHPERVERAVFIGHGMAMDPMQWVPFVPGLGEISMGRTEVFSDVFSPEHARRLAEAYAIRGTRSGLLTYIRRQYTIDGLRLVTGTYEDITRPVLQVHGGRDASIRSMRHAGSLHAWATRGSCWWKAPATTCTSMRPTRSWPPSWRSNSKRLRARAWSANARRRDRRALARVRSPSRYLTPLKIGRFASVAT